jgi:hypothetical protein
MITVLIKSKRSFSLSDLYCVSQRLRRNPVNKGARILEYQFEEQTDRAGIESALADIKANFGFIGSIKD